MDYARSLYQGGARYSANDSVLNRYSYAELGLRCLVCGEPVFHKRGYVKRSHFAHFQETSLQKLEECRLRQTQWGNGIPGDWSDIIRGDNQRLDIFREYFLSIVIKEIPDFGRKIQTLKLSNDSVVLEKIITNTYQVFRQNKIELRSKSCDLVSTNHDNFPLQLQIVIESIDYLSTLSSSELLKELLEYSIFVYLEAGSSNANISSISYGACNELINILISTNWVSGFNQVTGNRYSRPRDKRRLNSNLGENQGLEEIKPNHDLQSQIESMRPEEKFIKYLHSHPDFCYSKKREINFKELSLNPSRHYHFYFTKNNELELKYKTSFGEYIFISTLCRNISLSEDVSSSSKPVINLKLEPSGDYYDFFKKDIMRFIGSLYMKWSNNI